MSFKVCISKQAVIFYRADRNLFLTDINQHPKNVWVHLTVSKEWHSVTQGHQTENEPKMGHKSKSASDYSRENDDLVMETIKGKSELVCKPCCIITLLKNPPCVILKC